jgi:hypothetical protein
MKEWILGGILSIFIIVIGFLELRYLLKKRPSHIENCDSKKDGTDNKTGDI